MALTLRTTLRTRLAVWPYNDAAVVPHIPFPKASQIPLQLLNDSYSLPVPFSRKAIELLGRSTTSPSDWDIWYDQHNTAFARNFTDGTWCGYYTHFGVQHPSLDPPMTEIHFRELPPSAGYTYLDRVRGSTILMDLEARDCVDGVDSFNVNGALVLRDREVVFVGAKQYLSSPTRWDWDCRLTPFGLVGFWGPYQSAQRRVERFGMLWLWKKEWTELPA